MTKASSHLNTSLCQVCFFQLAKVLSLLRCDWSIVLCPPCQLTRQQLLLPPCQHLLHASHTVLSLILLKSTWKQELLKAAIFLSSWSQHHTLMESRHLLLRQYSTATCKYKRKLWKAELGVKERLMGSSNLPKVNMTQSWKTVIFPKSVWNSHREQSTKFWNILLYALNLLQSIGVLCMCVCILVFVLFFKGSFRLPLTFVTLKLNLESTLKALNLEWRAKLCNMFPNPSYSAQYLWKYVSLIITAQNLSLRLFW